MKPIRYSLLMAASLAALGLGTSLLHGQTASHALSATATQKQISIEIPALSPGQHWAVALEPQDGLQKFTVEADTVLGADPSVRPEVGSDALQPILSGYQIADSVFRLQDAPASPLSVFLDVHLPPARMVSIFSGEAVVFEGTITGPALLVDGQVDPKQDHPALRGKVLLLGPMAIPDELGPDLRSDWSGATAEASTAGLRRHLLSLPPVSSPLDGQAFSEANGEAALVVARIHINTAGSVTGVQIEKGNGPLASAAQHALQEAAFKPFLQNGKPIEVEGSVAYVLSDDGKLLDVSIR
jgi:hypothetical protein